MHISSHRSVHRTRPIALLLLLGNLAMASCSPAYSPDMKQIMLEAQQKNRPVFLELGRTGCFNCRKMLPVMARLRKNFGDRLLIRSVDLDTNPGPGRDFKVELLPTLIILNPNGKVLFRHSGYFPYSAIVTRLEKLKLGAH